MKAKIKIIIIFLIIFPLCTNAKSLENTCVYKGTYSYEKYGGLETVNVKYTCKFYDNNDYECDGNVGGKEDIYNWTSYVDGMFVAKPHYLQTRKCFDYLVFLDKGSLANRYSIFAADSYSSALSISSYEEKTSNGYDTGILELEGLNNVSESDNLYQKIESYSNMLNSFKQTSDPWELQNCLDEHGKLDSMSSNYTVCNNRLDQFYEDLNKWENEVSAAIANKTISPDDTRVINYRMAVANARSKVDSTIDQYRYNVDINVSQPEDSNIQTSDANCNSIFSGQFGVVLKNALSLLRFAVPLIIIGLSIVDFIKATAAQNDSEIKKAANKLVKRMIIGVIIFLLPTVLEFILYLAGIEYGTCGIK